MRTTLTLLILIAVVGGGLYAYTRFETSKLEARFPPVGDFFGAEGAELHYLDLPAGRAGQPTVLFVHGASGNLLDQYGAFGDAIRGKARALFVDRPGHGYSKLAGADDPAKQAERYLELLDALGVERVVLVGHSLGSASVAAFAVNYPDRVQGIVFLAPATHPWPGGVTWYYDVAAMPIIGDLFVNTLVMPVGKQSLPGGVKATFAPNKSPENYSEDSAVPLVLRPHIFRNNARDVKGLNEFVSEFSPRYAEIKKPTIVITGDADDIVAPSIHSVGLEKDIEGAELIILPGVGHKPDYAATDLVIESIMKVAGATGP